MENLKDIASDRLYRANGNNVVASNSIELPAEIDDLIDNKMYRNKFKKLVREGHLNDLLELAAIAHKVATQSPSRWFAKVCAKSRWEATLQWLRKTREVARAAAEVVKRISVAPDQMKALYKACWRRKDVMRHAVTAAETGKNQFNYFCWLVWRT